MTHEQKIIDGCYKVGQNTGDCVFGGTYRLCRRTVIIITTLLFGLIFFIYGLIHFKQKHLNN
jgi:hypothetical protein